MPICTDCKREAFSSASLIQILGGRFPASFLFSHFLSFSFTFSVAKHPLWMTTKGWLAKLLFSLKGSATGLRF